MYHIVERDIVGWISQVIITVYAQILRLYPRPFRTQFGDEMQAVFAQLLNSAAHRNLQAFIAVCLREARDLPQQIVREHLSGETRAMKRLLNYGKGQEVRLVRWITRIVSLLASLLFLYTFAVLAGREALPATAVPLAVLFALTSLSLLIAWHWEVLGGRLTMVFALLLGLAGGYATYSYGMTIPEIDPGMHLFATALAIVEWTIPFLIFGWLFAKVGRQSAMIEKTVP